MCAYGVNTKTNVLPILKYNLQFFAEENNDGNNDDSAGEGDDSSSSNGDNIENSGLDTEAFAELISDKDKRIEELEKEMKALKKSNAEMLVKMSAGANKPKDIGETIIDFCDTRKVKRSTAGKD